MLSLGQHCAFDGKSVRILGHWLNVCYGLLAQDELEDGSELEGKV